MKNLALLFALFIVALFIRCSEDETIEEQLIIQETLKSEVWYSGEEGDQDLDRKTRD